MRRTTKKLAVTGMFCALAYGAAAVGRFPLVLFLKYDPKDIVLAAGGLLLGPLPALAAAWGAALAEMLTVSGNGVLGFVMNGISSSLFAGTAAYLYRKRPTARGAALGLLCGWGCMTAGMLCWNALLAPVYMGCPREAVIKLLLPVFLPFNLFKGGVNAAVTLAVYRPIAAALERGHLLEQPEGPTPPSSGSR